MPAFTDKFIRGLKPAPAHYEERDVACPGLLVRVGKRGDKVWEVVVSQDGRRKRHRIGTYPDVSLSMARRLATERKAAPAIHGGGLRVADLWAMYSAEMRDKRRAWRDVEQVWKLWAEPKVGRVRLGDLGLLHGADLISDVVRRSSPNRARKVIRYLNPMLRYAAGRGLIPGNPWAGLSLPDGVESRDRVLTLDEWRAIWQWAESEPYPFGHWLRFLMLSAQRLGEVAGLRWDELQDDVWAIPASRHKGKRRHEVPLSCALVAMLGELPRHDAHAFSCRVGKPIVPGSKVKERIDRETGVSGWRFHDLRRTAATLMGEGGVSRFVIERVLGHADQGVTAIYDRATYRDEKRAALEVLAGTV